MIVALTKELVEHFSLLEVVGCCTIFICEGRNFRLFLIYHFPELFDIGGR